MKVEIDNTISFISIPFDFRICNPTFDVEKDVGLCVCVSSFCYNERMHKRKFKIKSSRLKMWKRDSKLNSPL